MMPNAGEDVIRTTGGQIDSIVLALVDAANDKHESVCHAICNSLHCIGQHQPNLVLSSCMAYIQRHPKMPLTHRVLLLNVMEHVCKNSTANISKNLVDQMVKMTVDEITTSKEVIPEWQSAASTILVALGRDHPTLVMEGLLVHFQPGTLPHFFVVHTLANLASANVFGMVPFLKALLGTMLPMLGMARSDSMKYVFAYALVNFSEAIHDYLANLEKAPDRSVTWESFMVEIGGAFDFLYANWLHSREPKVRAKVVEALGHMAQILDPKKLQEDLPRVLHDVVTLYRRQPDSHIMTTGLGLILTVATQLEPPISDMQVDAVLAAIFPPVCTIPDYSQPSIVKNHNEILRCFTILAPTNMERIINFLLFRLDNSNDAIRIGALTVLKHIINSCESFLGNKMELITTGLNGILLDPNNKVKKILAQVIVALAHHGYLNSADGKAMILFLVKQCALPPEDSFTSKRSKDPDYVSNDVLRNMCENVLYLLTTTVDSMSKVLWPDLLECLVELPYTPAVATICKILVALVEKQKEKGDFELALLPKSPSGAALFSRLVVMLAWQAQAMGHYILQFLRIIGGPLVGTTILALWDKTLPKLGELLPPSSGNSPSSNNGASAAKMFCNQSEWEAQLLDLVASTLNELDSEEWTIKFCHTLLDQIDLYKDTSLAKVFHFKVLGLTLKRVSNKTLVGQALDAIFERVNHLDPQEREGCSKAVGYVGESHLDLTLVKLEKVVKEELKKHSGIFSLLKDFKGDTEMDKVKATIILCYGEVALSAPSGLLQTRVETPILHNVANYYQTSKDPCVKHSMLLAVRLISQAIHPSHLKEPYDLKSRPELLNQMAVVMKHESPETALQSPTLSLALSAAANLVMLDSSNQDDCSSILETALASVFTLPRVDNSDPTWQAIVQSLHELLKQLLLRAHTPLNLTYLLKNLHPWFSSPKELERSRSMEEVVYLLNTYAEEIKPQTFSLFPPLGQLLGLVIPRCTDPSLVTRRLAINALSLLLKIDTISQDRPFEIPQTIKSLKESLDKEDSGALYNFTTELAQLLSDYLQTEHLMPFIKYLMMALKDPVSSCSSGSVVVLNQFFKLRGAELRQEISQIWEEMQVQMRGVTCNKTRVGLYHCVRSLATLHLGPMLSALLSAPLPLNQFHQECWHLLAQDPELASSILDFLLDQMTDNALCEPHPRQDVAKTVVASRPFVSLAALTEMFRVAEMGSLAEQHFAKILSILLMTAGAYVTATVLTPSSSPKSVTPEPKAKLVPAKCVTEALKAFLLCAHEEALVYHLADQGHWSLMENEHRFHEAISTLAQGICALNPKHVPRLFSSLQPNLGATIPNQKVVVVAFFAEMLAQQYPKKAEILEPLMSSLLGKLEDSCRLVRRLCIHGLGNVSGLSQFQKYGPTVVSAMMSGLDDRDDPDQEISQEAMDGLCSILGQVAPEHVDAVKILVNLRICCLFDKEKSSVKNSAFCLLGCLAELEGSRAAEESPAFSEEIHKTLVTVLVHLNDETDKNVVETCKKSLQKICVHLHSEEVQVVFHKFLEEDAHFHYEEFLGTFAKLMASLFSDKIAYYVTSALSYINSPHPYLQCNAVLLLGFLLGSLPPESHSLINKEKACNAIVGLLKDKTPAVRLRAAEALSYLHSY